MSGQLILYLALGQALAIAVLLLYLLVQRRTEEERERTEEERLAELRRVVEGWIRGEVEEAVARRRLERAPFPLVRGLLEATDDGAATRHGDGPGTAPGAGGASVGSGDDRSVAGLVRASTWWDRVERWSASPRFWWRRLRAAVLLRLAGRPEDAPLLLPLVRDERPVVASAALLVVRDLTPDALLEPLLDVAAEMEPGQGRLLGQALLAYGDRLAPRLRERLDGARPAGELKLLLRLAAGLADPALGDRVAALAEDDRVEVRVDAVRSLRSFAEPSVLPLFLAASEDPAWPVRVQAARGLGVVGGPEAVDRLADMLRDPAWWVRLRAAAALEGLGAAGRQELEGAREGEDRFARDMAGYVLRLAAGGGSAPSPAGAGP